MNWCDRQDCAEPCENADCPKIKDEELKQYIDELWHKETYESSLGG